MKAPTWGLLIGILMMLLGGCGFYNDYQSIDFKKSMNSQMERMSEFTGDDLPWEMTTEDSIALAQTPDSLLTEEQRNIKEAKEAIGQVLNISDRSNHLMRIFGMIGMVVSLLYFLGGLFLAWPKVFSIKLAYAALIISAVFGFVQWFFYNQDPDAGMISQATGITAAAGSFFDLIICAIVFASSKYAYEPDEEWID